MMPIIPCPMCIEAGSDNFEAYRGIHVFIDSIVTPDRRLFHRCYRVENHPNNGPIDFWIDNNRVMFGDAPENQVNNEK